MSSDDSITRLLSLLHPDGPWLLNAFHADTDRPAFSCFKPGNEVSTWARQQNAKRFNIYYSMAVPKTDAAKKLTKDDVANVACLWADVDPRKENKIVEDIGAERERLLANAKSWPYDLPKPSILVWSGNGFQAIWKLRQPVEDHNEIESRNDWIASQLDGDNVSNVDRLFRLPGLSNWPTKTKLKQGYGDEPQQSYIIEITDSEYDLDDFIKAEPAGGDVPRTNPAMAPPAGEATKLDDVHALDEWNVPDRVKAIIVQGNDPEKPKPGDNSRSGWLYDVCCNLVRCNVPDDVIYSVVTDPDFQISESVLDKGTGARRYALRTIARAKDEAVDPVLRELNDKYMVVKNLGGKCRVVHEIEEFGRRKLVKQSFEDFRNSYMNQSVLVSTKTDKDGNETPVFKPMGKWWLEHIRRRQFERIEFRPAQDVGDDIYNLWQGFAVEDRAGDCGLLIQHINDNICSGDEDLNRFVTSWMARAVQHPAEPGETAIVLRGGQGVGKSFFAKTLGKLFGQHYLHISNAGHVVGNFNAHLRDCVLLFGDEAFYAGDKRHESQLKTLVTEYTLMIEGKGIDAESSASCLHIILASNKKWVVPADADDRRFLVLDVGDGQKQNSQYFGAIQAQLDDGGYEALLHYLLNLDLAEFDHRSIPDTAAKRDQKIRSFDIYQQIIFEMLDEGDSRSACEDGEGHWVRGRELVRHIRGRSAETSIGTLLRTITDRKAKKLVQENGEQRRRWCYLLKPLSRARAAFEEHVGFKFEWTECQGWDESVEVQDEIPF